MSLCRFLPTPSERMSIIWSLLSIKDSLILEYGPAGTTHFSLGFYGKFTLPARERLFTTHMSEDDVVMGDVTRLEEALKELDVAYKPKVIFVVASSISVVIGTDIKGVCRYMQEEVAAKLIPVDRGGLNGDFTVGLREIYKILVRSLVNSATETKAGFNILGASAGSFRVASDIWEIENLMREVFGLEKKACLCYDTTLEEIGQLGNAKINLVLRQEAQPAAEILFKKFGTPYLITAPYGYQATIAWLEEVGKTLEQEAKITVISRLKQKNERLAQYRMYTRMFKKLKMQAALIGEYDFIKGVSIFLNSMGIDCKYKICSHTLKGIKDIAEDIIFCNEEKEKIVIFKQISDSLVIGDEVSLGICADSNTKIIASSPVLTETSIATHLPFVGEKGTDFLLEYVEKYLQKQI